jgi:parallel beta-helix repeat protein
LGRALFKIAKKRSATIFALFLSILLLSLFSELNFSYVKGDWGSTEPIYIRADGAIEPSNAPISTVDAVTYTLNDDIIGNNLLGIGMITVERSNVILDGKGHLIQCASRQSEESYPSGISIAGIGNVSINNFEIRGFWHGITPGINNKIAGNILADNTYGIFATGANNEITENQLIDNLVGLSIQWGGYNTVSKNVIKNKVKGIELVTNATHNKIFENTIENNGWGYENGCGVELYPAAPLSNYNLLYHNDFINNHLQIAQTDFGNINYWNKDFAIGGNYWSDYTGSDLYSGAFQNETCQDGIGDTPYIIDDNNLDEFPLLNPWQEHLNPPVARFRFKPDVNYALQEVAFNSSFSYDLDDNIKLFSWDFADGNTEATAQPVINHTFNLPRVYNVTLTVSDEKGLSTTYSQPVEIIAITYVSISAAPKLTTSGINVDLVGKLEDMFDQPLSDELVVLQYTFAGAGKWFPIASATTDNFGRFAVVWFPSATGEFTVKVDWAGNSTYARSHNTTNLDILYYESTYLFSIESNSTISSLTFDSSNRILSFSVSGSEGAEGYVRASISKSLIENINAVDVKINGIAIDYTVSSSDDLWILHFTYSHSAHNITMYLGTQSISIDYITIYLVFPAITIGVVVALLIVFLKKRRKRVS